ncbi:MAG: hypothetical protein HOM78_01325 [Candidatus Marinimicrobia bacterium]|jgi:hypothetical protein|nr:hypothetical protein [Candidatus Neomarinimicrobiota bacterium]MBT3838467.1 hypothetical protein [Candidatus Neomarinimicrobiota bacterium]MBT4283205.1 hypothetical protein [Candidatus Neomarinimicrobiota bacterium]MBT4579596.1 hypothetical protein [Candidatus Neomarinimicrobiota bacterium]MBT4956408.1 hypothetical protein [Candidatus Neomarinimicrobiota bacterium]
MNKSAFILCFIFISCSLYQDTESPDIYFEYSDFDILPLGRSISDVIISDNNNNLFMTDYNNNSLLNINLSGDLFIVGQVQLGSHPIALDFNSDKSILAIALEGESKIQTVDISTFEILDEYSIPLMNVNDIAFINDSIVVISSKTDPACITVNLISFEVESQSVLKGELAMDQENNILYVATSSSIKKYNWDGNRFFQDSNVADPYGFNGVVHHFIFDSAKNTVFACISSSDDTVLPIQHVYSYFGSDMTFAGKYLIKSPGLAVAVSNNGSRIFTAPTDADKIGVFIIEFDQETKLESKYYLSAGNLTHRGLVIDSNAENLYILVNIPGDDNSFEPYNDFSFDLQRIKL